MTRRFWMPLAFVVATGVAAGCGVRVELVNPEQRAAASTGLAVATPAVAVGDLAAFAASTGLEVPGWSASAGLRVEDAGTGVRVTATGVGPKSESAVFSFAAADFSQTEVVHVRLRTAGGPLPQRLRLDLIDAKGHGTNARPLEVTPRGSGVVDLVFDFDGRFQSAWPNPAEVDPSNIVALALLPNYGGPAYSGAFTVERIARSASTAIPTAVAPAGTATTLADATGAFLLDDFNDGRLNFSDPKIGTNSIGVSPGLVTGERDGRLFIESKGAGANYENVAYFFEPVDLSATPIIHARIRLAPGSRPVRFRADFLDLGGYGTSADPVEVRVTSSEWRDFVLDYRGRFNSVFPDPRPVDATKIGGAILFLNAGEGVTGTIEIDRFVRSASTQIPGDLGAAPAGGAAVAEAPVAAPAGGVALLADFASPLPASQTIGQPGWNINGLTVAPTADGTVTVRGTSSPPNFANAGLYFPLSDFRATPYVHVRARTVGGPANLRIDLVQDNTYGTNASPAVQTVAPGDFKDYVFDFRNKWSAVWPDARPVDPARIGGAVLFLNFDEAPFAGTLEIDRIVRSASATPPGEVAAAPGEPSQIQSALGAGNVAAVAVAPRITAQGRIDAARLASLATAAARPVADDAADSDAYLRRASTPARGDEAAVRARVQGLLSRMTLEEKVGQMTQITLEVVADKSSRPHKIDAAKLRRAVEQYHVGSILNTTDEALTVAEWRAVTDAVDAASRGTRLGIPVLYGVDAMHGANYTARAALFPQSLGMAATFNPALVEAGARLTARDVRAGGVPWNFAPVLDLGRNPAWPRFYETLGEDPHLASVLGVAQVRGLEGERVSDGQRVAATAKHFIGYSASRSGRDRTSTFLTERELRELYLPSFQAAFRAGIHSVMVNSGEINGLPIHAHRGLLTDLLRTEQGFDGVVVSDWEDIKKLVGIHRVAENEREATRMAVMAGVDLSMVPNDFSFYDHLLALARSGDVPMARIDEAVGRILTMKARLGLFDAPAARGAAPADSVGSAHSRAVALQAAHESIVVLRNGPGRSGPDAVLPLAAGKKVLVTGPAADSWRSLNNGWTYTWQGDGRAEQFFPRDRPTVLGALRAAAGEGNVTYVPGASFDTALNLSAAAEAARAADVAVVVLGESSYTEIVGSIDDLWLPRAQLDLLDAVAATGTPVVLVLVQGRPRTLGRHAEGANAIVLALNPGNEGGQAVADVLYGRVNPSGRLPFTYPSGASAFVAYDRTRADDQDTRFGFDAFKPLARFGDGLSYTTFAQSGLRVPETAALSDLDGGIPVEVTVENTGAVAGQEVVQVYVSDLVASVAPAAERLVRFGKVHLAPGERRTLRFRLDASALSFVTHTGERRVEPGRFAVRVADQTATFTLTGAAPRVLAPANPVLD